VRLPEWEVRILGERSHHISATGISVPTHGLIEEANHSDAAELGKLYAPVLSAHGKI
jgi:hypothetical protein